MFTTSKVFNAGRNCSKVHGASCSSYGHKCKHHNAGRVSILFRRPSSINETRKDISKTKQYSSEQRDRSRRITIDEIPKDWNREIERELGSYRDSINLVLAVMQMRKEQPSVKREYLDRARAKTANTAIISLYPRPNIIRSPGKLTSTASNSHSSSTVVPASSSSPYPYR